jgi:flavin reductase (DIM6/NTAB) family NADH-FMN oxidoreductase RutF
MLIAASFPRPAHIILGYARGQGGRSHQVGLRFDGVVKDAFDRLVSSLDYPMFIVTTSNGNDRAGCLVGFVTQASIDPPRLLVMLSKSNQTYRISLASSTLAVHFLDTADHALAELFGGETGDQIDKFERCAWSPGPGGVPLLENVKGTVVGNVIARLDCGDHVGHLLESTHVQRNNDQPSLSFQTVRELTPGHDA